LGVKISTWFESQPVMASRFFLGVYFTPARVLFRFKAAELEQTGFYLRFPAGFFGEAPALTDLLFGTC